jgi:hypothetical protein
MNLVRPNQLLPGGDPLALRGELVDVPVFVSCGGCCGLQDMRQY